MSDALRAAGICVIGGVLTFLLREVGFKGSRLVSAAVIIGAVSFAVIGIGEIASGLDGSAFGRDFSDAALLLLKIVGVGYLYGVSADFCREIGEGGIASALLVVGRVEILLQILPTVTKIIGLGLEYME